MTRRILALIAIGLLGGFLSGLFGIGGGVLMVPLLILVLKVDQRHASAMSLLAVLPAAIIGAITYGIEGHVDLIAAALIAAGGVVGALIGTRLLRRLSLAWLRWLFIAFLLLMAVRMLIETPEGTAGFEFTPFVVLGLLALGVVVGIASGLFGIGGGVIFVPTLTGIFAVTELVAKGTSLLAMVPTATTGSIANLRARLVRLPDGLALGISAAVAAYPGAIVAHTLPSRLSHVLFAVLVLIVVVQLTVRAIRDRSR